MTTPARTFLPADPLSPLELAAGPATLTVANGALRWVRVRGIETVRGIYGAVRDPSWGTIEPVFTSYEAAVGEEDFEIRFRAECVREVDGLDFAWTGSIVGTRDGTIRFVFDGAARSPFMAARIGLCVLHPPRLAGEPVEVRTQFGRMRGRFPDLVTSYYPFSNVTQIRHDAVRRHETQIDFSGEMFEMEDQRAFTDASFKTFSRPLGLPWPYRVDAAAAVRQVVTVAHPRAAGPGRHRVAGDAGDRPLAIRVGSATGRRVPTVGAGAAPPDVIADERIAAAVRGLGLAHLRVTVEAADAGAPARLDEAVAAAGDASAGLEVVLVAMPEDPAIEPLLGRLARSPVRVVRLLAVDPVRHATSAALAVRVHEAMRTVGLSSPLSGGSRGYLYNLLAQGIPADLVDLVSFPTNPQVHAFDEASIVETVAALPAAVRTAAALADGKPVAVGPVSLKALFNPDQVGPELPPPPGGLPARYDARQVTPFAAAWTLASAAALASAGAIALTLHETAGWAGLVAGAQAGLPAMPVEPGTILPVGHAVAALAGMANDELLEVEAPPSIHVLAGRGEAGRMRLLVANLGADARRVTVSVGRRAAEIAAAAVLVAEADGGATWSQVAIGGEVVEVPPNGIARLEGRRRPDR